VSSNKDDIELASNDQTTTSVPTTTAFLAKVEQVQACLQAIRKTTTTIHELREESLYSSNTSTTAQVNNKANFMDLLENGNQEAMKAKSYLKHLQGAATEGENGADVRMRQNMLRSMTNQFQNDVKKYQSAQEQYKRDMTNKVKRQIRIVQPKVTEDEIQDALENGVEPLYQRRILMMAGSKPSQEIQTKYHAIQERQNDLVTLERSLHELHQMFLDFALLTQQQSSLLDQIEYNVQSTNDNIQAANKEVVDSIWYQKWIRQKQFWIVVIVAIVLVVVVVALMG